MQSRRDQVQAHLFLMSRMSAAMMRAEPDTPDHPTARNWRGVIGGTILAILLAVGVGIYGLIVPLDDSSWRTPGAFVVVKDSSARYLYAGGRLRPVLNTASAKLVAGGQMSTVTVRAESLAGVPHGSPFGIVGAPDALPSAAGSFYGGTWWACVGTSSGYAPGPLGVSVGSVGGVTGLVADQGVLVTASAGGTQLLYGGRRFALDVKSGAAAALGWSTAGARRVDDAFLDTLSAGPDIAAPAVDKRGSAGPRLAGAATRYGQLFTGPGGRHYLLRRDGLVPLTGLLYDLVQGDPRTQSLAYGGGPVTAHTVGPADLAAHPAPTSAGAALAQDLPSTTPHLVTAGGDQAVCATVTPHTGGAPTVRVALAPAGAVAGGFPDLQPGVSAGCLAADRVSVPAGSGALVRALSSSGAGSTEYLVTDAGVAYPLPSGAPKALGYDGVNPVALPAEWVQLLPAGPALDPVELTNGGIVQPPPGLTAGCAANGGGKGVRYQRKHP
jgi:type VII secretion protein EccB